MQPKPQLMVHWLKWTSIVPQQQTVCAELGHHPLEKNSQLGIGRFTRVFGGHHFVYQFFCWLSHGQNLWPWTLRSLGRPASQSVTKYKLQRLILHLECGPVGFLPLLVELLVRSKWLVKTWLTLGSHPPLPQGEQLPT